MPGYVMILMGLPGCGKTATAKLLAKEFDMLHIEEDEIRKWLFAKEPTERLTEDYYIQPYNQFVWDASLLMAVANAQRGRKVILDGCHVNRRWRANVKNTLERANIMCDLIWFDVPEDTAIARIEERLKQPSAVSDGDVAAYHKLRKCFEPPRPSEIAQRVGPGGWDYNELHDYIGAVVKQLG